jgi:3-oxoacyl-[acyl-carrier protein] reductase
MPGLTGKTALVTGASRGIGRSIAERRVTWFANPEIVYAMTKGALNVFSRSLAQTLGSRGITVNTVSPGITETGMNTWLRDSPESAQRVAGMIALGRHGQPADIADAVAVFASEDGRWVPGRPWRSTAGCFSGLCRALTRRA